MKHNIKSNRLSLKSLKDELETLKSSKPSTTSFSKSESTDPNGKHNVITNYQTKSSVSLFWIFTFLLSYGHKIPFISKIIKLLSLWYGRTTWWKLLVKARKIFVILNAIIGVYTVFSVTGFSTDNIIAGVCGLGGTYLEMISSFTTRLFHWFVDLFDHKIVPKPPSNPSWRWWGPKENTWSTISDGPGKIVKLAQSQDFYKSPFNVSSPPQTSSWFDWSLSNVLWYAGFALVAAGVLYFGYNYFMVDPNVQAQLDATNAANAAARRAAAASDYIGKGKGRMTDIDPNFASGSGTHNHEVHVTEASAHNSPIELHDETTGPSATSAVFAYLGGKIRSLDSNVRNTLNPFNYFATTAQQTGDYSNFIDQQNDYLRANPNFYPFTEHNPYDSWATKLKKAMWGETTAEFFERTERKMYAQRIYNSLQVSRGLYTDLVLSPATTPYPATSPFPINVGLGNIVPITTNSVLETLQSVLIDNKIKSITPTPKDLPFLHDVEAWGSHVKEPQVWETVTSNSSASTTPKPSVPTTYSEVLRSTGVDHIPRVRKFE